MRWWRRRDSSLPYGLGALFPDGGTGRALDVDLPSGRLVEPEDLDRPAYWLSDEPVDSALWVDVRRQHAVSGLWPLLAAGLEGEPDRPWAVGEVDPQPVTEIDHLDPAVFLVENWQAEQESTEGHAAKVLAPFTGGWPGLAAPGEPARDADRVADQLVAADEPVDRLMLVAADRGADTLTTVGWEGPLNHSNAMAPLSAVLRSWENRFGIRVVRLGFDTLDVTVASPPATMEHALRVAAEHHAFCPDNIHQGAGTLEAYAAQILDDDVWTFWWD